MAATNYTPIQLYFSTTASAVPLAANLAQGELAINITDGKLYYEDNAGVVQVIATKGAGTIGGSTTQIQYNNAGALAGSAAMTFNSGTSTTTLTTLNLTNALGAIYGGTAQSTYAQGDVLYASATNTLSKLGIGAVNYILTSTGSVPQWSAPSSIIVQTATNLAGGLGGSVPYQSAVDTTTFLAIGAANRVMTSSGTAPQWVTSLTGLTGVSSSSITNTSLTSGRVVVSTTAGLQADDADLTFDGTTLSAGGFSTVGLSTLVKTVTIGNSSFNGSAVFAAATPAKLYMGTGTVTDVTSAISATNAVGAIASLGITPIAATNTSVTYTNAATLYIAGAPSAGTNVTLTNPYALYVAAGDAYFGGTVTAGTVNLTTLDLTNLEVTNIKAKDGTAAMTIADSTGVVSFTSNPILSGGTANGVLYLNGSKVATSGTALVFDGTNLGLGVTPSAWDTVVPAFQIGGAGGYIAAQGSAEVLRIGSNNYYNSSAFRYVINGSASRYDQTGGTHSWSTAPSGTAGNIITFTQAMTLNSSGELLVGGTTAFASTAGRGNISINGTSTCILGLGVNNLMVGYLFHDGTNMNLYNDKNGYLSFATNGTPRARFDSTGNFGIGTDNPARILAVNGIAKFMSTVTLGGTVTSTDSNAYFTNEAFANNIDSNSVTLGTVSSRPLLFATSSTERMRIDSVGNVGINANSIETWAKLQIQGTAGAQTGAKQQLYVIAPTSTAGEGVGIRLNAASGGKEAVGIIGVVNNATGTLGSMTFHVYNNGADIPEYMRLDNSGNLGLGTTPAAWSGYTTLQVKGGSFSSSSTEVEIAANAYYQGGWKYLNTGAIPAVRYEQYSGYHAFFTDSNSTHTAGDTVSFNQAMTLTNGGRLLVGTTTATFPINFRLPSDSGDWFSRFSNTTASSPYGSVFEYTAAAPNGTANEFIFCVDTGGQRMSVRSNGGIANYQANDANLSDRKEKTNFAPAKSYLDIICAIPVQTFNYIDQNLEEDGGLTLGVVAQDVQAVAPELVMESNWGTKEDPKMRLSIYQTDLQYALMKCIQEQQAIIESLKARLDAANL